MALSKSAASPGDCLSCACPAVCGALIAARDSHLYCVVCMGLKHAEEALEFPENCSHCLALPKKLRRRRHKVASTQSADFEQSDSDGGNGDHVAHPGDSWGAPALNWADQAESALLENILTDEPSILNKPPGFGDEDDAGLLEGSDDEEAIPPSVAPQAHEPAALPQSVLIKYCERGERGCSPQYRMAGITKCHRPGEGHL